MHKHFDSTAKQTISSIAVFVSFFFSHKSEVMIICKKKEQKKGQANMTF